MNLIRRHFFLLLVATTFPNLAHAYVDPGSGHLLLQLFLAFLAGALFYMRSIVDWFRGVSKDTEFDTGEIERETQNANANATATPTTVVAANRIPARKPKKAAATKKKTRTRKTATRKKAS